MSRALLILGCSRRKTDAPGPAWRVYDGPLYHVLRKRLGPRAHWPRGLDVLIVSARHGLIRADRKITPYDDALDGREPPGLWSGALRRHLVYRKYDYVHINLGHAYARTLGSLDGVFGRAEVTCGAGGIGCRAAQLVAWLSARISDS